LAPKPSGVLAGGMADDRAMRITDIAATWIGVRNQLNVKWKQTKAFTRVSIGGRELS